MPYGLSRNIGIGGKSEIQAEPGARTSMKRGPTTPGTRRLGTATKTTDSRQPKPKAPKIPNYGRPKYADYYNYQPDPGLLEKARLNRGIENKETAPAVEESSNPVLARRLEFVNELMARLRQATPARTS